MISAPDRVQDSSPIADRQVVASLSQASKSYGEVTALDGIDLEIRDGEVLALLGPNGAGKTTAVKLLLGLARPDGGNATLFGGSPSDNRSRLRLGTMLQVSKVPETLRVSEHIELFSSYYDHPLPIAQTLASAGLSGLEERPYGELSGGQQQRLLFALALCGDPDLLILDEPTVGLDVEARRGMWREIRRFVETGGTILLTTHYLDEVDALADRVVVLHGGTILAEGTPAQIKSEASGRRIRCTSVLKAADVESWPSVTRARRDGATLEIIATEGDQVVRQLMSVDPTVSALEITSPGLEDAFLALTEAASSKTPSILPNSQ